MVNVPFNKGKRLIVVHAGSVSGFVSGAKVIFKANTSTGDYHGEMNGEIFTKWLNEKLIPNLPLHSVVLINNAPYHTICDDKYPTKSSTKSVMTSWLQRHNIQFRQNMLKDLCQKHKPAEPINRTDLILMQHGHECVRLPLYHADLNPIELIWANMKGKVAAKNLTFKFKDVQALVDDAIGDITSDDWKSCVKHVETVESGYYA
jgi:transposase